MGKGLQSSEQAESPSTRRVWIEMLSTAPWYNDQRSPSTRRVWIEIGYHSPRVRGRQSPSTRRVWIEIDDSDLLIEAFNSHPPHGGCG